MSGWEMCAVLTGGAAGALIDLLSVSVSIRIDVMADVRVLSLVGTTAGHSRTRQGSKPARSHSSARHPHPIELACEVLAEYDAALEDLRRLASETSHAGTKLGAIRGRVEAITLRTQLQMALGLVPRDLGDLAVVLDGRRTAEVSWGVLERFNASDEMWDAMEAAFGLSP